MKLPLILAVAFVALCCGSCAKTGSTEPQAVRGPVRFYRERVRVEPCDGRTRVVGHYFLRNASDDSVSVEIEYPFPVDLHHARPFRVRAWLRRDGEFRPLGFLNGSESIRFRLNFEPRADHEIRVEYSQKISRPHAVYIVKTTNLWGEPIELAEFEFYVPKAVGEVRFSFEPDRAEDRGDTVVYSMSRTGFMPQRDLEVWWE